MVARLRCSQGKPLRPTAVWVMSWMVLVLLGACSSSTGLVTTPTVALGPAGKELFANVPPELRRPEMEVLYAADRSVQKRSVPGPEYSAGRSGHLTFGVAVVDFDPSITWNELVRDSTTRERTGQVTLVLRSVKEKNVLAVPLSRMEVRDGRYRLPAATLTELEIARSDLHGLLRERLALTPHKDVYLYVHGFRSRFQDAVFGIAQVWHFMGRPGVPVAYTWPAGHGGIAGYAYDRESGEFTVYHLKKFILAVVACPEVRRLHLIAHSRGTDVVCTALRELNIEFKAKGLDTAEELKLENLVLAAPDLDTDVFEQRFGIEDLHRAARRTTVYLSRADFALKTANWLFSGQRRLGNLSMEDLVPESRCKLTQLPSLHLVNCNVTGYSSSHNYVFKHPAAFSDLILVLRDRRDPGATCGRPLGTPVEGIWLIDNDYLLSPQPSGTPEGVLQRQ